MGYPISGRIQFRFVEGTSEESIEKFFRTIRIFKPHIFYPGLEYREHPAEPGLWMMRVKHSSEGTAINHIRGYKIIESVSMADSDAYDRFVRADYDPTTKQCLKDL